uniref:Uncharacterized protein n=1 Tax=Triticum urartu TaxID=4572 RepID=A0A8R7TFZ1_TRIUA
SVLADLLWPFNFASSGRSASGARQRAPRSRLCVEFRASSTAVCCSLLFSTECAAMCGFTLDSPGWSSFAFSHRSIVHSQYRL